MAPTEHRYGTVPPRRRRLFVLALAAVGLVVLISGLVFNAVTATAVAWGWLAAAVGFAMAIYAVYLWIRLSD